MLAEGHRRPLSPAWVRKTCSPLTEPEMRNKERGHQKEGAVEAGRGQGHILSQEASQNATGCSSISQTYPQRQTHYLCPPARLQTFTGRVTLLYQASEAGCCLLGKSATGNTSHYSLIRGAPTGAKSWSSPKQIKPFFPGYLHLYDFIVQASLVNSFKSLLEFEREKVCF